MTGDDRLRPGGLSDLAAEYKRLHVGTEGPTPLADFLLARIAEDEAAARAAMWDRRHDKRHAPSRVLAECESKRLIVGFVDAWFADAAVEHIVLKYLALPYADHPDYRQEWKPHA